MTAKKLKKPKLIYLGTAKRKLNKEEDSDKDEEKSSQDVTFGQSNSKSKSTVLTGEIKGLSSEIEKPNNLGRRETYKKKGMSSTSSAFIPPNKLRFAESKVVFITLQFL